MVKAWLHSRGVEASRRTLSQLPSVPSPTRPYSPSQVKSWNRLTILFYSSVISTAAAADVAMKRKRREQWDEAIAEVKSSLARPTNRSLDRTSSHFNPSVEIHQHAGVEYQSHGQKQTSISNNAGGAYSDLPTQPSPPVRRKWNKAGCPAPASNRLLSRNSALIGSTDSVPQRPSLHSVTELAGSGHVASTLLAEKVYADTHGSRASIYASAARRAHKWKPWVPKKLLRTEFSIAKLAARLLVEADRGSSKDAQDDQVLEHTLKDISRRFERLRTMDSFNLQGIQRLQFPQFRLHDGPRDRGTVALNADLMCAIRKLAEKETTYPAMIREIAYKLLMSPVPPDTATYTILINRLSRLRHQLISPKAIDFVIESMRETCVRPDEMTVSAVLSHYARMKDFWKFHKYVGKILGESGGLMLARPDLPTDGLCSPRLRQYEEKVAQSFRINSFIAEVIIRGYLYFNEESAAMDLYRRMQKQGIMPTAGVLHSFLQFYAVNNRWEAGIALWEEAEAHGFSDPNANEEAAALFYNALKLCRSCGKGKEFRSIYQKGLSHGISTDGLLRKPPRVHRGFSLEDDYNQRRKRLIHQLETRVFMLIEESVRWALQIYVSKMLLLGYSLPELEANFRRFGAKTSEDSWFKSRPWLWNKNLERLMSKSAPEQASASRQQMLKSATGCLGGATQDPQLPVGSSPTSEQPSHYHKISSPKILRHPSHWRQAKSEAIVA